MSFNWHDGGHERRHDCGRLPAFGIRLCQADWRMDVQLSDCGPDRPRWPETGEVLSVGVDGDTIVAGSPYVYVSGGAAYIWVEPSSGWANMMQTARLTPGKGEAGIFGCSVAISGGTIVVGASDNGYDQAGAAYVFQRPATGWKTTNRFGAKLLPPVSSQFDYFGTSVSVNGPTISVTALDGPSLAGSAYVFDRQLATGAVH